MNVLSLSHKHTIISPLFIPVVFLISSIAFSMARHINNLSLSAAVLYFIFVLGYSAFIYHAQNKAFALSIVSLVLIGWFQTSHKINTFHQFPFDKTKEKINIQGTVLDIQKVSRAGSKEKIMIALDQIYLGSEDISSTHTLVIYSRRYSNAQVGDTLLIKDLSIKKPNSENFAHYLMKEGLLATIFIDTLSYEIIHSPLFSFKKIVFTWRNRIENSIKRALSYKASILFNMLFLGEKERAKKSIEQLRHQCQRWGISHYLARSGLHLVMVIALYELIFKLLPLSFALKHILLILLTLLYFFLTWPTISFIRAFFVFLLCKSLHLIRIPIHTTHALILTCSIILISNPLQLFFLDFQLSFLLTFALCLTNQYKTP